MRKGICSVFGVSRRCGGAAAKRKSGNGSQSGERSVSGGNVRRTFDALRPPSHQSAGQDRGHSHRFGPRPQGMLSVRTMPSGASRHRTPTRYSHTHIDVFQLDGKRSQLGQRPAAFPVRTVKHTIRERHSKRSIENSNHPCRTYLYRGCPTSPRN